MNLLAVYSNWYIAFVILLLSNTVYADLAINHLSIGNVDIPKELIMYIVTFIFIDNRYVKSSEDGSHTKICK
jgi:hypothetical protein